MSPGQAMTLEHPAPAGRGPLVLRPGEPVAARAGPVASPAGGLGVCRTNLQLCEGDLAMRRSPIVPGHQAVGRVEAIGPDVDGWSLGDRAGVAWLAGTCGVCSFCRSGRENLSCEPPSPVGTSTAGTPPTWWYGPISPCGYLRDSADLQVAPLLCGGVIWVSFAETFRYRAGRAARSVPDSGPRLSSPSRWRDTGAVESSWPPAQRTSRRGRERSAPSGPAVTTMLRPSPWTRRSRSRHQGTSYAPPCGR